MDKFRQVDSTVEAVAKSQFVGAPVNGLDDGGGPHVVLLDVFKEWRAVGSVADG
jgi:hypothetical protein